MTSMRIDGDKSAKVWAKRLRNLVDAMEEDGAEVRTHETLPLIAVFKDGDAWTTGGEDVNKL